MPAALGHAQGDSSLSTLGSKRRALEFFSDERESCGDVTNSDAASQDLISADHPEADVLARMRTARGPIDAGDDLPQPARKRARVSSTSHVARPRTYYDDNNSACSNSNDEDESSSSSASDASDDEDLPENEGDRQASRLERAQQLQNTGAVRHRSITPPPLPSQSSQPARAPRELENPHSPPRRGSLNPQSFSSAAPDASGPLQRAAKCIMEAMERGKGCVRIRDLTNILQTPVAAKDMLEAFVLSGALTKSPCAPMRDLGDESPLPSKGAREVSMEADEVYVDARDVPRPLLEYFVHPLPTPTKDEHPACNLAARVALGKSNVEKPMCFVPPSPEDMRVYQMRCMEEFSARYEEFYRFVTREAHHLQGVSQQGLEPH